MSKRVWVDDGAVYETEEDGGQDSIAQGNEIEMGTWHQGSPVLAVLETRNLSDLLNYLLSLVNNIKMTKTEFPYSRNSQV